MFFSSQALRELVSFPVRAGFTCAPIWHLNNVHLDPNNTSWDVWWFGSFCQGLMFFLPRKWSLGVTTLALTDLNALQSQKPGQPEVCLPPLWDSSFQVLNCYNSKLFPPPAALGLAVSSYSCFLHDNLMFSFSLSLMFSYLVSFILNWQFSM